MSLEKLAWLSNSYGNNPEYVLAGGGNTSFKENGILYIKGSGASLKTIKPENFVKMEMKKLDGIWKKEYPQNTAEREEAVLLDLMDARVKGETGRPSVETSLHALMPYQYVVHLHPSKVNGLTCSVRGKKAAETLFGDSFIWIENIEPGYVLAKRVKEELEAYQAEKGGCAKIILLQNHGIFVAADSTDEVAGMYHDMMNKIENAVTEKPDFSGAEYHKERAAMIAPAVRMLVSGGDTAIVTFFTNQTIRAFIKDEKAFEPLSSAYSPDHIVYCKAEMLFVNRFDDLEKQYGELTCKISAYKKRYGYAPGIIALQGVGVFSAGSSKKEAETAKMLFLDAVKIAVYTKSFGGHSFMPGHLIDFIKNWEAERYRKGSYNKEKKRALEKIVIVTGSAQGFGHGIAREMLEEGANVVIADLNGALAEKNAAEFCNIYGGGRAVFALADVADEESVKEMVYTAVIEYGGLDVLINNAGIVRAGGLDEMTLEDLELVNRVNYNAYFLCAKYASKIMKIQNRFQCGYLMDIIQINSKSGLAGSNKNFAYAGSKFGGIGLTQSFALELVAYNIKVNSVCPGNFLDGPLWCDEDKGLFRQYLDAGKVPGAKTIGDVKRFYESKVPMNRGCRVEDVAKAIFYCMEQPYETGQAIPVTGGQCMLK